MNQFETDNCVCPDAVHGRAYESIDTALLLISVAVVAPIFIAVTEALRALGRVLVETNWEFVLFAVIFCVISVVIVFGLFIYFVKVYTDYRYHNKIPGSISVMTNLIRHVVDTVHQFGYERDLSDCVVNHFGFDALDTDERAAWFDHQVLDFIRDIPEDLVDAFDTPTTEFDSLISPNALDAYRRAVEATRKKLTLAT